MPQKLFICCYFFFSNVGTNTLVLVFQDKPLKLLHNSWAQASWGRAVGFLFGHRNVSDSNDEQTEHKDFGSYGFSGSSLWPWNLSQIYRVVTCLGVKAFLSSPLPVAVSVCLWETGNIAVPWEELPALEQQSSLQGRFLLLLFRTRSMLCVAPWQAWEYLRRMFILYC